MSCRGEHQLHFTDWTPGAQISLYLPTETQRREPSLPDSKALLCLPAIGTERSLRFLEEMSSIFRGLCLEYQEA